MKTNRPILTLDHLVIYIMNEYWKYAFRAKNIVLYNVLGEIHRTSGMHRKLTKILERQRHNKPMQWVSAHVVEKTKKSNVGFNSKITS